MMRFDVPSIVINKLFEQGYEEQVLDIVMAFETDPSKEVSDIPLSPALINDNGENIIFTNEVLQEYKKLVERIKNPTTAQEIPFFLFGNAKNIDGQDYVVIQEIKYSINGNLDDLRVSIDEGKFRELVTNSNYDVISIGHTHGNVSEEKKQQSLTRQLPPDLVEKYAIRDVGLNISIADIWQHEAFKQIASQLGNKKILQSIIMYNGDIIMIDDNSISKSNNVQAILENGNLVSLPTSTQHQNLSVHR